MMLRNLRCVGGSLLLLLGLALVLSAHASTTPKSIFPVAASYCPDCSEGGTTNLAACVRTARGGANPGSFSCRTCRNATDPNDRRAMCAQTLYSTFSSTCISLLTSASHCGACGNDCHAKLGAGSACVDGVCTCTHASCYEKSLVDWTSSYCSAASKKCESCPPNYGHCSVALDTGDASDCSTDLLTSIHHCGACGRSCATKGNRCVGGVCMCGNNAACSGNKSFCIAGDCYACVVGGRVLCNHESNVFQLQEFCEHQSGTCQKCPLGTGDCTPFSTQPFVFDSGTIHDCDNRLDGSGRVEHCGTCGASTDTHAGLTCCAGVAKCGRFADPSHPTLEECQAAKMCGSRQYCDAGTMKCLPFDSLFHSEQNCKANAAHPLERTPLDVPGKCGSCNATRSRLREVQVHTENTTRTICTYADSRNCGALGKVCPRLQKCVKGECVCATTAPEWLSYSPFLALDPEVNHSTRGRPARGCEINAPVKMMSEAFARRGRGYIESFMDCAARTGRLTVALRDFESSKARKEICSGALNRCNTTYCESLYMKSRELKTNGMCEAFAAYGEWFGACAGKYRGPAEPADPTCRTVAAYELLKGLPTYSLSFIEVSLFLRCPETNRLRGIEDYVIPITPYTHLSFLRYALTRMYTGPAAVSSGSRIVFGAVLGVAIFIVL